MSDPLRERKWPLWAAAMWVTFALSAYLLQTRARLPRGSELYYEGLGHSLRLAGDFAQQRLLPAVALLFLATVFGSQEEGFKPFVDPSAEPDRDPSLRNAGLRLQLANG